MVCLPNGAPLCETCPLASLCRAHALGNQADLPVKAKSKPRRVEDRTLFLLTCGGKLALRRRPDTGLLAGLWELPAAEGTLTREEAAALLARWGLSITGDLAPGVPSRHVFSHVEWHMTAWQAQVGEEAPGFAWATPEELQREYPLPSAFAAYFPKGAKLGKTGGRR